MSPTHADFAALFKSIENENDGAVAKMLASSPALTQCGIILDDKKAYSPLHVAAHRGAVKVSRLLIDAGANPNESMRLKRRRAR